MKLNDLIRLADRHYPDGSVARCWDFRRSEPVDAGAGDTLALFIARELADTFDPERLSLNHLDAAEIALAKAAEDLRLVIRGFRQARRRMFRKPRLSG